MFFFGYLGYCINMLFIMGEKLIVIYLVKNYYLEYRMDFKNKRGNNNKKKFNKIR